MKYSNVIFKGQFEKALEKFLRGVDIDMRDFSNGSWDATTPFQSFLYRLNKVGLRYTVISGESLRTKIIRKA